MAAAREAFANSSYDQVGVREIADSAQVNVALLNRYYRSKKQLFKETLHGQGLFVREAVKGDRSMAGKRLLENILANQSNEGLNSFLLFVRSVSSDEVSGIVRSELHRQFAEPLAEWLGGKAALQRADLIGSILCGILMSRLLMNGVQNGMSPSGLIKNIAPVIQTYIDGKNF